MRLALVTGSDSGIGKATAVALAAAGYDVGITWHEDKDGAAETAQEVEAAGRGGRIVNITTVHEHVPLRGSVAYCAAKGGLGLMTKVMAMELAEHGITVNAVAPGEIATPMTGQEDVDPHGQHRPAVPLGRPGDAREVAALVVYLASEQASYTTGSSYVVDGGMLLMAAEANRITLEAKG